jgi:hypothetical protein
VYFSPIWFQSDFSPFSRYRPTAASTTTAMPSQITIRIGGSGSSTTRETRGSRAMLCAHTERSLGTTQNATPSQWYQQGTT